jgi:VWFA-related protein
MRRGGLVLVMAAALVLVARAQETPQPQQPPSFRAGVELISLDVSVLDKDRRPVRGLTAADFTVLENGKPQRVVTLSSVDAAQRDPARSAWMRYATRDVAANDLADQLGDGHLYAIVIDDMNLPPDDPDILLTARSAARHIVDLFGPSDRAAIVFAQDAGKTQDFTDDRDKLLEAIDRLQPHQPFSIEQMAVGPGPGGGDMAQRSSALLGRSPCFRNEPVIPALDAATSQLATVPGGRKTLFYIGVGVVVTGTRGGCDGVIGGALRDIFRRAQRANVNIHAIDPGGIDSYRQYIERSFAAREQEARISGRRMPSANLRSLKDFLRTIADNTGGRAVTDTDAIEPAIDRIFDEDGSYYLLGYETSNPDADGKFRKIEVTVDRPGASVRTRSGYWAPERGSVENRRGDRLASATDMSLAGLASTVGLPMRVNVVALAADAKPGLVDAGIVLTVRWPAVREPTSDTLTIVRNVYDADGRPGPPSQEAVPVTLQPAGGDETRVDVRRRIALAPGRYQLRLNVRSASLNRGGSIYADLEVPDVARSTLSLSGIVLGTARADDPSNAALAGLVPLVPTTARDFAPSDTLDAFVRVFQGGAAPPVDVTLTTEIFDAANTSRFSQTTTVSAGTFATARSAGAQVALPLDRLTAGPYLLSTTASLPNGRKARRDLIFRIRG